MKINQIKIEKLFNHFDYTIDFHNNITIIHGPNGCGKTTTLKIIDATFNKKLDILKNIDFQFVQFFFSNDTSLKIEKKRVQLDEHNSFFNLAYTINENQKFDSFETSDDYIEYLKNFIKMHRSFMWIEKRQDNMWFDRRFGKYLSTEEVISKYGMEIYKRYGRGFIDESIPEEVQLFLDAIDVRLISADRLTIPKRIENKYGEDSIKIEQRVDVIANELSQKIRNTIQYYAQLAQAKDRTFPFRAINHTSSMTIEEIKNKIIALEAKRKELIESGILEEEEDSIDITKLVDDITDDNYQNLSLLSLYVIDTAEKLDTLSNLSSSINLFRKLIDNNFNHKKIVFNKDYGFKFLTTYSSSPIAPQNLSSGEQHELVMFYDLIFNTSENTLILIDEPELSLHIKWQLSYIDELLAIIKSTNFSAILATHSPQIIHDKWNLTVSLSQ